MFAGRTATSQPEQSGRCNTCKLATSIVQPFLLPRGVNLTWYIPTNCSLFNMSALLLSYIFLWLVVWE